MKQKNTIVLIVFKGERNGSTTYDIDTKMNDTDILRDEIDSQH